MDTSYLRHDRLVLGICCSALFLAGLDVTAVNVALPDVRTDLGASVAGLQWVVDAYTLGLATLFLLSGSLADRFGRRRVFSLGLAVFAAASTLCALAPGTGWLIAARAAQSLGGAMLNPVALAIVVNTFPAPAQRARAIGVWASVSGLALAAGPLLGGVLVAAAGWRSIFWLNVPLALAALAATRRFVPESRPAIARRADPFAQVLLVVALASITAAVIESPGRALAPGWIAALLALAGLCTVALIAHERRRVQPMIDPAMFTSASFTGALAMALAAFTALGALLFANTLYLQDARGLSPLGAGLAVLPLALAATVLAPLAGRWVARFGTRAPLVAAGAAIATAGALLVGLSETTPVLRLMGAYLAFGIGYGLVNAPITTTAVGGLPRARAAVASATTSTTRQLGTAIGVAIAGAILTGSSGPTLAPASGAVWWLVLGCGMAIVVLALASTSAWARATAERARARWSEEERAQEADHGRTAPPPARP